MFSKDLFKERTSNRDRNYLRGKACIYLKYTVFTQANETESKEYLIFLRTFVMRGERMFVALRTVVSI